MALNKVGLKSDIGTLLNALLAFDNSSGQTQADAIDKFKNDLANAIDTYVKTATVNVTSVAGVTTGAGVSGPGTGTLS